MTPVIRLKPGESSDSGFCSTPALTSQVSAIFFHLNLIFYFYFFAFVFFYVYDLKTHKRRKMHIVFIHAYLFSALFYHKKASATTNQTHAVSTWPPHSQDPVTSLDRPHTISTAYEKGHQRPPLTVYTFQNPDGTSNVAQQQQQQVQKSPANVACRPPLPIRCSSLERPLSSTAGARNSTIQNMRQSPSPLPTHITNGKMTQTQKRLRIK